MNEKRERFELLVVEALPQELRGWDFRFLEGRWVEGATSWDYREKVLTYIEGAKVLLDMGTGGGEFLSSLLPLHAQTYATEGYAPNVPLAKARLEPLGVQVVEVGSDDLLPFEMRRLR